MAVRHPRPAAELARIFAHPGHMAGSDGIFIGAHPHPRAFGTFARYLRVYVRERGTWSWADAVHHLSTGPPRGSPWARRGTVAAGAVADLVLVDPETVADTATYADPRRTARASTTSSSPGSGPRRRRADRRPAGPRAPPRPTDHNRERK